MIVAILFSILLLPTETFAHEVEYVVREEKPVLTTGTTLYLTDPLYNDPNEGVSRLIFLLPYKAKIALLPVLS